MTLSARTVLFAGDSITSGMPGASYFDLVAARLATNPAWAGALPLNAGRGGDTVEALLHRLPPLLERHHPRWAILAIGHNDVWLPCLRAQDTLMDVILAGRARVLHQVPAPNLEAFKAAYHTLIDIIQECVGQRLVICTCSVIGEDISSPTNRTTSRVNDLIRILAETRGLELADVWAAFSQELAEHSTGCPARFPIPDGWQYVKEHLRSRLAPPREVSPRQGLRLTLDGVHPNPRGAGLWAKVVWQALSSAADRLGI